MAHSLEIRTPLVDLELLKALSSVTPSLKPGAGKQALADAPRTPLPAATVDRPKTGFGTPIGRWCAAATDVTVKSKGAASRTWAGEVFDGSKVRLNSTAFGQATLAVAAE
jgi:asparagine synthase (glutamine-hydrolysing)